MKKCLFIIGTRPEAIKLAPIIKEQYQTKHFDPIVYLSGQHPKMAADILNFFGINIHHHDIIERSNGDLNGLSATLLTNIDTYIQKTAPDCVIIQGDTQTAFAGALAAYNRKLPIIHIEAGLRTNNHHQPFPEEANRQLIARLASYHLCTSSLAVQNLRNENIQQNIYNVGNTVIDALLQTQQLNNTKYANQLNDSFEKQGLVFSKQHILITLHRRENQGDNFNNVINAIHHLADRFDCINFSFSDAPKPHYQRQSDKRI